MCRFHQVSLAFITALLLLSGGLVAQVPDEFTNLQVLSEDITQRELIDVMKGFVNALDVRCEHCHLGEPGQPLSTFDFASDEKQTKRSARVMMQITHDLNLSIPERLGRSAAEAVRVRCVTCHRGQDKPRLILEIMKSEAEAEGIEGALAKYRSLRDESYGTGTYDFSLLPLQAWASDLARGGDAAAALEVLDLAESYFPDSIDVQVLVGEVHLVAGDQDLATDQFRRVLELDPDNQVATMRLEQLGSPEPE